MSDIFISYKREEQAIARNLANALEGEGWTVWWDPKLRAGEHFDDVIEKALNEAKCVIVIWSERSVQSRYVRNEATYALEKGKLVPVAIETVDLPFRFKGIHTLSLLGWDGSKDASEFRRLVEDIAPIVGPPATERQKGLKPGTVLRDKLKDGSQEPEMQVIPPGMFLMGDIDGCGNEYERPVHPVRIISPFAIGRYEVTFEEYDRFATAMGRELPGDYGWGRRQRPVINVSWNDAVEYAKWLSAQTGKRYRLPSEAEWEYAARSGGKEERWAGTSREQELSEYAWYVANTDFKTQPIGGRKPNGLGLYDMSGNVQEWVQDWWHFNYDDAPKDGSAWLQGENDIERVMRGGSWNDVPGFLRSSFRYRDSATFRNWNIGFRLAQDVD
jgi:formylglycine-generating enzyme required for sulfatase activity